MKSLKSFIVLLLFMLIPISTNAYDYLSEADINNKSITYIDIRSENARNRLGGNKPNAIWVDPHSLMKINNFLKDNLNKKDKKFAIFCACPNDEYAIALAEIMEREGYSKVYVLSQGWDILNSHNLIKF